MTERADTQVLRHAVGYTAATYAVQVITLAVALVIKRLLGPVNVGIWTSLMLLQGYLQLAHLRITDAAQKEISYRRGRGEDEAAGELRDVMFSASLALALVLGGATVATAAFLAPAQAPEYRIGLAAVGALFPLTQALACATVMLRAHKRFDRLGRTLLVIALANAALQVPLALAWGFPGFVLAYALASAVQAAYWWLLVPERRFLVFRPRWHWPTLRRLLAVGIPMQVGGLVNLLFRSLDQIMLLARLGPAALGLYSIGVSVNNFVYGIPNAVSVVTFPNFQERYGRSGSSSALLELVVVPVQALAFVVLPLAVGSAYLLLPPLVRHLLPQFADGIGAAQILLVGTFALSLNHMPGQFLITIDRQLPGIAVAAAGTAALAAAVWTALRLGLGVEGVAAATAIAYTLATMALLAVALSLAGSPRAAVTLPVQCLVALGWTWGAAHTAARLVAAPAAPWWRDFGAAALAALVFCVLIAPLIAYFQLRTGLLGAILRGRRAA